jgi:hypothetical protein
VRAAQLVGRELVGQSGRQARPEVRQYRVLDLAGEHRQVVRQCGDRGRTRLGGGRGRRDGECRRRVRDVLPVSQQLVRFRPTGQKRGRRGGIGGGEGDVAVERGAGRGPSNPGRRGGAQLVLPDHVVQQPGALLDGKHTNDSGAEGEHDERGEQQAEPALGAPCGPDHPRP